MLILQMSDGFIGFLGFGLESLEDLIPMCERFPGLFHDLFI
jgi:hypothetical protein